MSKQRRLTFYDMDERVSRDTLTDGDKVRQLLEEARECPHTGDNDIFALDAYLRVNYEKEGNIRLCDIATALSHFTDVSPHPSATSSAMVARIHREGARE